MTPNVHTIGQRGSLLIQQLKVDFKIIKPTVAMHDTRRSENLATLRPGQSGQLADYGAMNGDSVRRFKALGFTPGRKIYCIRKATFGCPIEFEVLGTRIAMRANDAREIRVLDPLPSDS